SAAASRRLRPRCRGHHAFHSQATRRVGLEARQGRLTMKILHLPIAAMFGWAAAAAFAADKPCTPADSANPAKKGDLVMNWGQLAKAQKDFGHCDTGNVADVFTDALMRLAVDWKNVDQFAAVMKDPSFKAFVAAHIKSPAAKDDREAVYSRATLSCPKGQDEVCKEVAAMIKEPAAKEPAKE